MQILGMNKGDHKGKGDSGTPVEPPAAQTAPPSSDSGGEAGGATGVEAREKQEGGALKDAGAGGGAAGGDKAAADPVQDAAVNNSSVKAEAKSVGKVGGLAAGGAEAGVADKFALGEEVSFGHLASLGVNHAGFDMGAKVNLFPRTLQ